MLIGEECTILQLEKLEGALICFLRELVGERGPKLGFLGPATDACAVKKGAGAWRFGLLAGMD